MKISARNVLSGTVSEVNTGKVMAIVKLSLKGGNVLTSTITNESAERLGLKSGTSAYAIIKASSVMIGKGMDGVNISARNIIKGKVQKIKEGMVMAEVVLDIGESSIISATISDESVKRLNLKTGEEVYAVIKATSVMLGIAE
ncbi:MAG: TOBE domain-containing protein [Dissulfurispiraceae bacterium]|jgi:molybdate transport system regulatory protein|nr:TOBE domain-containing protein [Dissulfurispiraceae bacterium]